VGLYLSFQDSPSAISEHGEDLEELSFRFFGLLKIAQKEAAITV
jgi:hypothetical protein